MNLQYAFEIPLPLEVVWQALLDVPRVAPCLPGAAIESSEGDQYLGRMKVRLGPIEMTYRGTLKLARRDDANHTAVLTAAGNEIKGGGGATANITLQAVSSTTGSAVKVTSDVNVSGRAAQFGRGVMEEIGAKLIAQFSDRLSKEMAAVQPAQAAASAAVASAGTLSPACPVQGAPPEALPAVVAATARSADEALDVGRLAWSVIGRRLIPIAVVIMLIVIAGIYLFVLKS
jgi:uncharacterized protein